MSTYRGYSVPEVIEEHGIFYIADEKFGWFQSRTKEIALLHWHNKVDTVIIRDAIEMELIVYTDIPDRFGCKECGLLINDVFLHLNWHRSH